MPKIDIKLIYKYFLMGIIITFIISYYTISFAAPDPRFLAMDKNGDNLVSQQEFLDSNPNMNANAYAIIDANNDKYVTFEEWTIFQQKHSMPDGLKVDADRITNLPAKRTPDEPVKPIAPNAPTMQNMQNIQNMNNMNNMPLMQPMQSMFDKNPNEVEEVKVPLVIHNSSSFPLLSTPSIQAPSTPSVDKPSLNTNSTTQNLDSIIPLLSPK